MRFLVRVAVDDWEHWEQTSSISLDHLIGWKITTKTVESAKCWATHAVGRSLMDGEWRIDAINSIVLRRRLVHGGFLIIHHLERPLSYESTAVPDLFPLSHGATKGASGHARLASDSQSDGCRIRSNIPIAVSAIFCAVENPHLPSKSSTMCGTRDVIAGCALC